MIQGYFPRQGQIHISFEISELTLMPKTESYQEHKKLKCVNNIHVLTFWKRRRNEKFSAHWEFSLRFTVLRLETWKRKLVPFCNRKKRYKWNYAPFRETCLLYPSTVVFCFSFKSIKIDNAIHFLKVSGIWNNAI